GTGSRGAGPHPDRLRPLDPRPRSETEPPPPAVDDRRRRGHRRGPRRAARRQEHFPPLGATSMRLHDAGPRDDTPETTRVFWGHDYGTRGEETPERPFFEKQLPGEGFFYRVRLRVRRIAP